MALPVAPFKAHKPACRKGDGEIHMPGQQAFGFGKP